METDSKKQAVFEAVLEVAWGIRKVKMVSGSQWQDEIGRFCCSQRHSEMSAPLGLASAVSNRNPIREHRNP